MRASVESVTSEQAGRAPLRILLCGANWLGDSVMMMPAVQAFRRRHPDALLSMLVKPALAALWRMHAAIDTVATLHATVGGTVAAGLLLRKDRFDAAYVFPRSFRSAFAAFLSGAPERAGLPGHARRWLLTRMVLPDLRPGRLHQAFEYVDLLGVGAAGKAPERPRLEPGDGLMARARDILAGAGLPGLPSAGAGPDMPLLVGVVPGAAHGPSKRWPPERFAEVGRRLAARHGCRCVVLGTRPEQALCRAVQARIGRDAVDLAGRLALPEFAAVLAMCPLVICNDSGGMHLAAAVGSRVVAVFGVTDPARTGPLGGGHRVVQRSLKRSRDIPRESEEAVAGLCQVSADDVLNAAEAALPARSAGVGA